MNPTKVIWTKEDNFDTIHAKLSKLVGKKVIGKVDNRFSDKKELIYTIFSIGPIEKTSIPCTFSSKKGSFSKHFSDTTGFGFPEPSEKPMWGFEVKFGFEGKEGRKLIYTYTITMPRNKDYQEDLKRCGIMEDPSHPFIFYEL